MLIGFAQQRDKLVFIAHATVGMEQAPSLQWHPRKQQFIGLAQADQRISESDFVSVCDIDN